MVYTCVTIPHPSGRFPVCSAGAVFCVRRRGRACFRALGVGEVVVEGCSVYTCAVLCCAVLCCAWVCLSLWGSGWCFFCCCTWEGMCTAFLFPLLLLFSLRALHLHQLALPPHCWICHSLGSFSCVLGWGSLNLAVPRGVCLLSFSLWGCVHLPAFASFVCVFRRSCLFVVVGRVFFALGAG